MKLKKLGIELVVRIILLIIAIVVGIILYAWLSDYVSGTTTLISKAGEMEK